MRRRNLPQRVAPRLRARASLKEVPPLLCLRSYVLGLERLIQRVGRARIATIDYEATGRGWGGVRCRAPGSPRTDVAEVRGRVPPLEDSAEIRLDLSAERVGSTVDPQLHGKI